MTRHLMGFVGIYRLVACDEEELFIVRAGVCLEGVLYWHLSSICTSGVRARDLWWSLRHFFPGRGRGAAAACTPHLISCLVSMRCLIPPSAASFFFLLFHDWHDMRYLADIRLYEDI